MGPKDTLPVIAPEQTADSVQQAVEDLSDVPVKDIEQLNIVPQPETITPAQSMSEISAPTTALEATSTTQSITEKFISFFLLALKLYMKRTPAHDPQLPVLASTFHAKFLLPLLNDAGENEQISVQKTEFKKFNTFLLHMQEQRLIKLEEKVKGVQSISAVNLGHELFRSLTSDEQMNRRITVEDPQDHDKKSKPAEFKEMFSITAAVLPLIRTFDAIAKKGDSISSPDFRRLVTNYVKEAGLVDLATSAKSPKVRLDTLLAGCLGKQEGENVAWPTLFDSLFAAMQPCYQFQFKDGQAGTKKGKPPCITISSAKRSGNKKILLINNLQAVGIDPSTFAKDLQVAMAASATLNHGLAESVCQGPQVQIQGSHTDQVVRMLCQKYNVPKTLVKVA